MKLTIIFRNSTQITIDTDFTDEEMKSLHAAAKTRRAQHLHDIFIDFSEVIFYSLAQQEDNE